MEVEQRIKLGNDECALRLGRGYSAVCVDEGGRVELRVAM